MDSGSQGRTRWDAVTDGSVTMPVNDHMGFVLEETGDPRNAVTFTWMPRTSISVLLATGAMSAT